MSVKLWVDADAEPEEEVQHICIETIQMTVAPLVGEMVIINRHSYIVQDRYWDLSGHPTLNLKLVSQVKKTERPLHRANQR